MLVELRGPERMRVSLVAENVLGQMVRPVRPRHSPRIAARRCHGQLGSDVAGCLERLDGRAAQLVEDVECEGRAVRGPVQGAEDLSERVQGP